MAKCEVCGKGPATGHNVSHAHNRTKRVFAPNIQKKRVFINGKFQRVKICTRCLRTLTRKGSISA